jgi:hypothetical protein
MVIGDLMMTCHVVMEEDPCTMEIRPLEAQRLPQLAQRIAHYAKTSPLGGMTSSFRAYLFCKFKLYFVKGQIKEVALPNFCFTLS